MSYAAGVVLDRGLVARERAENGPWRELAPRAAPVEPVALGGELITLEEPRAGWVVVAGGQVAQITGSRPEGVPCSRPGGDPAGAARSA